MYKELSDVGSNTIYRAKIRVRYGLCLGLVEGVLCYSKGKD